MKGFKSKRQEKLYSKLIPSLTTQDQGKGTCPDGSRIRGKTKKRKRFHDQREELGYSIIEDCNGEDFQYRLKNLKQEVQDAFLFIEQHIEDILKKVPQKSSEFPKGFGLSIFGGQAERIHKIGLWKHSLEVDEFGKDPIFQNSMSALFNFLYKKWWRVDTSGLEHIPDSGRVLLVANHAGILPYDSAMIAWGVWHAHPAHREIRPLVEDFVFHMPFLAALISRLGGVRACQENAERLLRKGAGVVVFPEGIKGNVKYYRNRYQLQRFGRGGFIRLCMRTQTPIVPVSVIGSEEIHPIIARPDWLGRVFGIPATPITPFFPLLGPLGFIPLPSKWYIQFGEQIDIGLYGPEAESDSILVNRLTQKVREIIQEMVRENLKRRKSPFFG